MGNHIKWDEKTQTILDEGKDTKDFILDLSMATKMRAEAKELEDQAKVLKDKANQLAKVAMPILGLEKSMSNLGGLTYVGPGENHKLDKDGVKQYLLGKGVPTVTVNTAFKNNTTTTPKDGYIKFVAPKGDKK